MVQQTSIESYHKVTEEELGSKQFAVYHYLIDNGPSTNRQIAKGLALPINTITPRVLELREFGMVKKAHLCFDFETSRRVIAWEVDL